MKAKGYDMVLTSTQVDEEDQHFYRKLGYKDYGIILCKKNLICKFSKKLLK